MEYGDRCHTLVAEADAEVVGLVTTVFSYAIGRPRGRTALE